jgi:glutathione S-transferase
MTLTIYGSPRSRTMRVLWAAAGLGLDCQHVPLAWDDPAFKSPEFLRLRPAGAVPVVVDDDGFALAESMAIILYLAKSTERRAGTPRRPKARPRRGAGACGQPGGGG